MAAKKQSEKRTSQKKVYEVPLRSITKNTNPRNPLSKSLESQGWDCMKGEKQIWPLAVSEDAAERGLFVKLIEDFDPAIVSMAATIRAIGLETPIEVRESGSGTFTLVFGARRCLATLFNWALLGKPKEPWIEASLVKGNEADLLTRALVENIRKPQSVIEEAKAIKMAVNIGEKREEIADHLGMSMKTLKSRLDLLNLDPKEQQKIHEGKKSVKKVKEEANGKPKKPPMRSRTEVTAAMEEFPESRPERKVLEWMLGMREKIA